MALLLGVVSSWWNPVLQETLRRKGGRAVGTAEFYKLQGILLIVRCVTWRYLPGAELSEQMVKAAHLSLLVLALIVSVRLADMEAEANTFIDDRHILSLRSIRLFGSSQVSRQSRAVGMSDNVRAESVQRGARGFWSHP